jgi:glycosyltransferase involved in cell wall biosynthesis
LFLSRISWKKGLDRLLQAWTEVPDLALVIAGYDDEGYQAKLEDIARTLGIADRVHFVGPASDDHKWALYEAAEMFVLPSYNENFGNVVAEAMAMACPVVISPDIGIADLVRESRAGIVTDCEPAPLAEAIRSLHANPARRAEMGMRGHAAAIDHLSWGAVAAEMEAVYHRLISAVSPA